ncbi:Papain fold toxin 1, glutamine deamidase [Lachnospiraceae bacterium C10]|nr:Papain fold toxin 1, glutamine deamidase [Lachnospiraceae bacterium C10]
MLDFNIDGILSAPDSPLSRKASLAEKIADAKTLDSPIAQHIDVQEKTGRFFENPSVEGVKSWIKEINPNYDPFDLESPYNVNCGACAYVVYERLNGIDATCASANNIPTDPEMEELLGKRIISMSPNEIAKRLMDAGNGAHAVIGVDRANGPGHWFNAACLDGKVVAIDGQSGEVLDWPPDYGDVINWEMSV